MASDLPVSYYSSTYLALSLQPVLLVKQGSQYKALAWYYNVLRCYLRSYHRLGIGSKEAARENGTQHHPEEILLLHIGNGGYSHAGRK